MINITRLHCIDEAYCYTSHDPWSVRVCLSVCVFGTHVRKHCKNRWTAVTVITAVIIIKSIIWLPKVDRPNNENCCRNVLWVSHICSSPLTGKPRLWRVPSRVECFQLSISLFYSAVDVFTCIWIMSYRGSNNLGRYRIRLSRCDRESYTPISDCRTCSSARHCYRFAAELLYCPLSRLAPAALPIAGVQNSPTVYLLIEMHFTVTYTLFQKTSTFLFFE